MNSSEQKLPKLTKLLQHDERHGMSLFQDYSGIISGLLTYLKSILEPFTVVPRPTLSLCSQKT